MKIDPADFSSVISKALEEYGNLVDDALEKAVTKVSKESVNELKKGGIYQTRNRSKYTGSWTSKKEKSRTGMTAVVYNAKSPGLAHLLEFGHATKAGGRTRAFPHIEPVNDKVADRMVDYLEENV